MNDINRFYTPADMVRIAGATCAGCGKCCRGMGDTIVLDPWDAAHLTARLGKPFDSMLDREVDLHAEEGMIVPHLKMQEGTQACAFLGEDGLCGIHEARPGICRLFPLGRQYTEGESLYFVVEGGCTEPGKTKTRIDKWLGIPGGKEGLRRYEAFKKEWHAFTKEMKAMFAGTQEEPADPETVRQINVYLLQQFFVRPYPPEDFYNAFEERLGRIRALFV
ncbi:MAG: YkgJ family cysteine cluster protein [Lachnospiraceae bacterium]|nr:YkgJ family cysteine cluster protein [Lachnospiraceae bacterium]